MTRLNKSHTPNKFIIFRRTNRRIKKTAQFIELIIVAAIAAFCIKAVLFEPSIVPSNSMMPTIYGCTWESIDGQRAPRNQRDNTPEYQYTLIQAAKNYLRTRGEDPESFPIFKPWPKPSLLKKRVGERVIVNKFVFGAWFPGTLIPGIHLDWIRLPALRKPKRGDLIVFTPNEIRGDRNNEIWVKRVIGLPGEYFSYYNKTVYINGKPLDESEWMTLPKDNYYRDDGIENVVREQFYIPPASYYVLGDNRNGSYDSRAIGPIPERNIRGMVVFRFWPLNRFGPIH